MGINKPSPKRKKKEGLPSIIKNTETPNKNQKLNYNKFKNVYYKKKRKLLQLYRLWN